MRLIVPVAVSAASLVLSLAACGTGPVARSSYAAASALPTPGASGSKVTRAQLLGRWEVIQVANAAYLGCECHVVSRDAYVSFEANGTMSGSDGTNTWSSHFTTSGSSLRIAAGSTTLVGLTTSASATQKDLQAAYESLMRGGSVDDLMFGVYLALNAGHYGLLLARPVGR